MWPIKKSMLYDLNKFFPLFFLIAVIGIFPFGGLVISEGLKAAGMVGVEANKIIDFALPWMVVILFPVVFWLWRKSAVSTPPIIGKENDYKRGHIALAAGNAIFLLPTLIEILNSMMHGSQFYWFSMFSVIISGPLWLAGWGMINRSASWEIPKK